MWRTNCKRRFCPLNSSIAVDAETLHLLPAQISEQPLFASHIAMLSLAFSSTSYVAPVSKMSQSRVARSGCVEMAKKSVGDLTEADLKGKKVRHPQRIARATSRKHARPAHSADRSLAGPGALRPERPARRQDHHR